MKHLPKPGAPSDRPLAVAIRFLARVIASVKRRTSATSDAVQVPSSASAAAVGAAGE